MDNIKTWTGLTMEESVRMAEDRDKWRKYIHGVANPRIEDGYRTEQTLTKTYFCCIASYSIVVKRSIIERITVNCINCTVLLPGITRI